MENVLKLKRFGQSALATIVLVPALVHADVGSDAEKVGLNFLHSHILQCDGQDFINYHWGISDGTPHYLQILEPKSALLVDKSLTDVDRLNGTEWRGGMRLTFKAIRSLDMAPVSSCGGSDCAAFNESHKNDVPTWGWSDWATRDSGITVMYGKKNGQWVGLPSMDGVFGDPGTCAAIPLAPPKVSLSPSTAAPTPAQTPSSKGNTASKKAPPVPGKPWTI
jgi:hypothetical protein